MAPSVSLEDVLHALARLEDDDMFIKKGWSRLMIECIYGDSLTKIQNMLEQGEDVNAIHDNKTALMVASVGQNVDTVKLLLEFGADVNLVVEETQETVLWHVSAHDISKSRSDEEIYINVVTTLLEAGADTAHKMHGFTLMGKMVLENRKSFARALVQYVDVNAKDAHGNTPLDYAIIMKNAEMKSLLQEAGATVTRIGNLPAPFFKYFTL